MKKFNFVFLFLLLPLNSYSMHIMEGFLPVKWALGWWIVALPFIYTGIAAVRRIVAVRPHLKPLLAMAGAFAFVLSALKLPSVTGSSSHMTGVGLGTLLFGPFTMTLLGFIVLLFQALLLAHGGITTLGANTFSMAVAGPFITYVFYMFCSRLISSEKINVFTASFMGNITTYIITAVQLSAAHPDAGGGMTGALGKFLVIFAVTQIPLAVIEGLLTVVIVNLLMSYATDDLKFSGLITMKRSGEYEK